LSDSRRVGEGVCAALMPLMVVIEVLMLAVTGCLGYCSSSIMQKHKRCSYTAKDFVTLASATRCKSFIEKKKNYLKNNFFHLISN